MSTISSFRSIENKHDVCRGKDCMKKFCEYVRERAMKIVNFKKNKNEIVNKREEQQESYENTKSVIIVEKNLNKYSGAAATGGPGCHGPTTFLQSKIKSN